MLPAPQLGRIRRPPVRPPRWQLPPLRQIWERGEDGMGGHGAPVEIAAAALPLVDTPDMESEVGQRVGEGQHEQDGRGRHRRRFLHVRRRRSFLRDRRHHRRQLPSSPCTSVPRPSRRRGRHRQRRAPPATPLPGGGGWGRSRTGKEEGSRWGRRMRGRWVGGEEIEKRGDSGWLKGISQRA